MRKKIEIPTLHNLDEVNETLKRRCQIQRDLDLIKLVMNEKIESAKAEAEKETTPLIEKAGILEMSLEQYSIHHKEEFDSARSKVLTFGTIGFRKTPGALKTLAKWTWEQVLAKLQEMKSNKYIRIKPSVDKEAIEKDFKAEKINDEYLSTIGLKWNSNDEFYFVLNEEEVTANGHE